MDKEIEWKKKEKKGPEIININELMHEKAVQSICDLAKMPKDLDIEERAKVYSKCGGFVSSGAPTLTETIQRAEIFEKYNSATKILVRWHPHDIRTDRHYEILIHPKELTYMVNGTMLKDVKEGEPIKEVDINWKEESIKEFKNKKELYKI